MSAGSERKEEDEKDINTEENNEATKEKDETSKEDSIVITIKNMKDCINGTAEFLKSKYPDNDFTAILMDDQYTYDVAEFTMDGKIIFRQIIPIGSTQKELNENTLGTLERNLRVFEKLSVEYLEKHNQEIMVMDQAEVKSIRTIKEDE